MQAPKMLEEATRGNLTKPLKELLESGEDITITDESLPISMNVTLKFK
jgi:ubiquitin-activating enzyme E1 C